MRDNYKGYRYPKSVIGYAVRLYNRYKLSFRDVRDILLERGVDVSHETIRAWCGQWGAIYAKAIHRKRGSSYTDKWHIDEVHLTIKGEVFWLWRLVATKPRPQNIGRTSKMPLGFSMKLLNHSTSTSKKGGG